MSPSRRAFLSMAPFAALPLLGRASPAHAQEAPDRTWIKARALRRGDAIRLVAPAGPAEPARVEACRRRFEAMGFRVIIPQDLFRRDRYLAGTDAERLDELNAAIRDPDARAIFPCRGGYGLMRILAGIDYQAIRADPKIITGYSDLTALHLAVARQARVITFHSPMPQSSLDSDDDEFAYANSSFWKTIQGEGSKLVGLPVGRPRPIGLVGGSATGRLVGGNLTLIAATLGTPYAVEPDGNILLVEDTGEAPYRVDRLFAQLRLAGVLDRIAGLVIGTFDQTDAEATAVVVREHCSRLKVPVLLNFPVGHTPFNVTLPHGGRVLIEADSARLSLAEDPVRSE